MSTKKKKREVKPVVKQPIVELETKSEILNEVEKLTEESLDINKYPEFLDEVEDKSEEIIIDSVIIPILEEPIIEFIEKLSEEQPKKRTIDSLTRNELRYFQRTGIMPS